MSLSKPSREKLFDCSALESFRESIKEILPYSGASRAVFFHCEFEGIRFLCKVSRVIQNERENNGPLSDALAEIKILGALKTHIIDRGFTPCILELIYHKTCKDVSRPAVSSPDEESFARRSFDETVFEMIDLARFGLARNELHFLVLEECDITMEDFVRGNMTTPPAIEIFRSLLFMIVHAIYSVKTVFPGFEHKDLHAKNILLKYDKKIGFNPHNPLWLNFQTSLGAFNVPYYGMIPKIIDYGSSILPEKNLRADEGVVTYRDFFRPHDDIHHFLIHLYSVCVQANAEHFASVIVQISSAVPGISKYTAATFPVGFIVPTLSAMIESPAFSMYREEPTNGKIHKKYRAPTQEE